MAETPNSPEGVAYQLFKDIIALEGAAPADRAALLATYGECLRAVRVDIVKAAPTHGRSAF
jgi:hypothetical protein